MDIPKDPQSLKQKIQETMQKTEEALSDMVEINHKLQTTEAVAAALKKTVAMPAGGKDTLVDDLAKIQIEANQRDQRLKDLDAKIKKIATDVVNKASQNLPTQQ